MLTQTQTHVYIHIQKLVQFGQLIIASGSLFCDVIGLASRKLVWPIVRQWFMEHALRTYYASLLLTKLLCVTYTHICVCILYKYSRPFVACASAQTKTITHFVAALQASYIFELLFLFSQGKSWVKFSVNYLCEWKLIVHMYLLYLPTINAFINEIFKYAPCCLHKFDSQLKSSLWLPFTASATYYQNFINLHESQGLHTHTNTLLLSGKYVYVN